MRSILLVCMLMSYDCMAKEVETISLTGKNTLILDGTITDRYVDTFATAVVGKRILLLPEETLYVVVDSIGGWYSSAKTLRAFLGGVPNVKMVCVSCASAAGYVFALSSSDRLVTADSKILMHEMFMQHVTAKDMRDESKTREFLDSSDEFNRLMYKKIGMSKEAYSEKITDTAWEVEGSDIISLRLADKLVGVSCDSYITHLLPDVCK